MKNLFLLILALFVSLSVKAQVASDTLIMLPDLSEMKIEDSLTRVSLKGFRLENGKLRQDEIQGLLFVDYLRTSFKVTFNNGTSLELDGNHTLVTRDEVVIKAKNLTPGLQVIRGGGALATVLSIEMKQAEKKFYHFYVEGGGFYIANGLIVGDMSTQMTNR